MHFGTFITLTYPLFFSGSVGELITNPVKFEYVDLPNFPKSTVIGHVGRLIFGQIENVPVICMQGRFHFYEGNSLSRCVMPVRLMKLLGVSTLIVTNAAGSVNAEYKAGDVMIIKDHINFVGFAGNNPLRGPNDESFGPRFIAMNNAYNQSIIKDAKAIVQKLGLKGFHEGVYACVGGPNYETVAEMRALKVLGCDAVGMSTVHEIITARHCGLTCFAFSLITNEGVLSYDTKNKPDAEDIVNVATQKKQELKIFLKNLIPYLVKNKF